MVHNDPEFQIIVEPAPLDIWAERPIRPSSETIQMFETRRYSWEYRLKIEYDKLKEKADKLEAVKTWRAEHHFTRTEMWNLGIRKLDEILGVKPDGC